VTCSVGLPPGGHFNRLDVRYWHKADIKGLTSSVRFRGNSGHRADWRSGCLLMTLLRHSAAAIESPLDGLLLSPRRKAYQPK